MHILWSHGYAFGCLSLIWVEEPGAAMEGGVLVPRTTVFSWKREGRCLIRNHVLCSLFKRLWGHHMWREVNLWRSPEGEGGMQWQQQGVQGSEILYKACVTSWAAESRTRWHVCLGKDIPELQKRCWVSWEMGREAGQQQNFDKWVTRQKQELREHVRVCSYGAFAPQELIPDDSAV